MNKCVICFTEHTNEWNNGPSMYCELCWPIRESARATYNPVLGTIYLGDMKSAEQFDGMRLCVYDTAPTYQGEYIHIPILEKRPNSSFDRTGAIVSVDRLNAACDLINEYFTTNKKLLVHCHGGIERSPLTVAWWLSAQAPYVCNINEAYTFLKLVRPAVSPRLFWLPKDHELYQEIS